MCSFDACRVHTLAMAVVEDAPSLFRAADGGATLALLAKLTVETAQQCKMEEARNKLQVHACSDHVLDNGPSAQSLFACTFPLSRSKAMCPHVLPPATWRLRDNLIRRMGSFNNFLW